MRVALLIALLVAGPAAAQLRTIPADAERGEMRHLQENIVELNGQRVLLAPGAQIRDAGNLIVVPAALPQGAKVKYLLDAQEMVNRVWILSPQEIAQPDPKK